MAGITGLTGCGAIGGLVSSPTSAIYPTYKDFAAEAAKLADTSWIPDDATDIRIKYHQSRPGTLLTFHTEKGLAEGACTTGPRPTPPDLNDTWWPTEVPKDVFLCKDWSVFQAFGNYYGETQIAPR
ncbi:hypothetical protein D9V32_02470 [Mycetocola tolaasinivorans]|uniref:Uncharacterized protein n=1 Tax=Mycetocola tolaasinivorans TaxID=76635 RepID=A0A3L7AA55_9MICO|nr:hypothetical protein D9V32_02470 [Mycetocola tolaasinivorans]